jgi:L-alanine-DL-glutamate epimerase-like enolase superfamily enzyme
MIRVLSAEAIPIAFELSEAYRIAGADISRAENIILKVDTSDGRTGFGSAAPAEEVTGESGAASLRALNDLLIPMLREEADARDPRAVARRGLEIAPSAPAARAAVDIALYDLLGRREGLPLARLLGLRRSRLLTSITLGISADRAATLDKARRHVDAGFRALKLKVGEDWEGDARLVRDLRQTLGPDILLRADGNQGYSEDQARRFLAAVAEAGLELLEQPTAAGDLGVLARLSAAASAPIMADESIKTSADARRIIDAGAAGLVNIKLMKCGGITEALEIASVTGAAGVGAMIGCNDESRISISAALHFALAASSVERADLDGHLDIIDDPARGGVRIEAGYIMPSGDDSGIGVRVDL